MVYDILRREKSFKKSSDDYNSTYNPKFGLSITVKLDFYSEEAYYDTIHCIPFSITAFVTIPLFFRDTPILVEIVNLDPYRRQNMGDMEIEEQDHKIDSSYIDKLCDIIEERIRADTEDNVDTVEDLQRRWWRIFIKYLEEENPENAKNYGLNDYTSFDPEHAFHFFLHPTQNIDSFGIHITLKVLGTNDNV